MNQRYFGNVLLWACAFLFFLWAGSDPVMADQSIRQGEWVVRMQQGTDLPELRQKIGRDRFMDRIFRNRLDIIPLLPQNRGERMTDGEGAGQYYLFRTEPRLDGLLQSYLRRHENVDLMEPNHIRQTQLIPNDTEFGRQWALRNTGQSGGVTGADIKATDAWQNTAGSDDVVVAIIDTGIDMTHPDLVGQLWENPLETDNNGVDDDGNGLVDDRHGWNFVEGNNDIEDQDGHGTHVAGIVAASTNDATGIAGVCGGNAAASESGCRLMILRACSGQGAGGCLSSDIVQAIYYALDPDGDPTTQDGADIINLSLGSSGVSQAEQAAVAAARQQGVLVVAAAGNQGSIQPFYPAGYEEVIAVAASDASDRKALFSNYGSWVDISAPGDGIYSALPGSGYGYRSGTSMAAPQVSGLLGLMRARYPEQSATDLVNLLLTTVDDIDQLNPDYAGLLGAGRINAYRAVKGEVILAAQIDTPEAGTYNSASLTIRGDAGVVADQQTAINWTLAYRQSGVTSQWVNLKQVLNTQQYQHDDVLHAWDIRDLSDGEYDLRLLVEESLDPSHFVSTQRQIQIDRSAAYILPTGWPQTTGGQGVFASPLIVPPLLGEQNPASIVMVGDRNGTLVAWDAAGNALPGWPVQLSVGIYGAPALAVLNDEGERAVFVSTLSGKVYGLNLEGDFLPGWETPKQVGSLWAVAPVVADLTGDGVPEVMIADGNGRLHVWRVDGSLLWAHNLPDGVIHSTVAVGDISQDNQNEILVGTENGGLYLVTAGGESSLFATASGNIYGAPVLADLDHNGSLEVIVPSYNASGTGFVEVFDHMGQLQWRHTLEAQLYDIAVGDFSNDQQLSVVAADFAGNVYRFDADGGGSIVATLENGVRSQPLIAELTESGVPAIVLADMAGTVRVIDAAGKALSEPYALGTRVEHAAPATADVDGDGDLEVLIATTNGQVMLLDFRGENTLSAVQWGTYHGRSSRRGIYHMAPTMIGDVSQNGTISAFDASLVMQHLEGGSRLFGSSLENGQRIWHPVETLTMSDAEAILYCAVRGGQYPQCLEGFSPGSAL